MSSLRKNVAGQHIGFQLISKTDGSDITAGGAGSVTIDNGAQAACTGAFTHSGSGSWDYAPSQAETNGTAINFRFTGTGAISVGMFFLTDNWDTTQPVLTSGGGANQVTVNGTGKVSGVVLADTVTVLTNLPAITANWLTAAGINAGALNGKGDWLLASSYVAPLNLSAAATATAVWTDATAGDFTVALSIGKSIMNGVALGTGLTVNDLTTKTGFSLSATGLNSIVMQDLGAPPGATASVVAGLSWLFMSVQNDRKTTSTQDKIHNSAGAVVGTATVSDDAVTYEKTIFA